MVNKALFCYEEWGIFLVCQGALYSPPTPALKSETRGCLLLPSSTLGMGADSHSVCEQAPCPACRPPRDTSVIPVVNLESLAPESTAVTKLGAHKPAVHVSHVWYMVHCTVHKGGFTMPQTPEGQPLINGG